MTAGAVDILLVEDNPNDVELTLHALQANRLPTRVEVARDGAEALEFVFGTGRHTERSREDRPRMIHLDLKLPLVGGLEVLAKIKADPATKAIPVVVLTSSREEPDIKRAYACGANSYIVKPVDFEQFSEAMRNLGLYWLRLNLAPQSTAGG